MIKLGLLGARGRMGQWVIQLLQNEFSDRATLSVQVNSGGSLQALLETDAIIDFSSAEAMNTLISLSLKESRKLPAFIIGSTGWTVEHLKQIDQLAKRTPVLLASNFSPGVFLTSEILRQFAPLLRKLNYSPVLVETHHQHKKDSPSGTALSLQKCIDAEDPRSIQTHSIRAGEVIGTHNVTFFGAGDEITIQHFARDRSIFARGAIETALWLANKQKTSQKLDSRVLGMDDYFRDLKGV